MPGDTAVVAYGQPNVLAAAGMASPYPYLWSLPVRTLDPDLTAVAAVLAGADRPRGSSTGRASTRGRIDPAALRPVLARHYREVADVCGRTVWLEQDEPRSLATPGGCP